MVLLLSQNEECFYTGTDSWLIGVSGNVSYRLFSHFQHVSIMLSSRSGLCALLPHWAMDGTGIPVFV